MHDTFQGLDTAYYIPNFITTEEETRLVTQIKKVPKPKWTILKNRSLQNWGRFYSLYYTGLL